MVSTSTRSSGRTIYPHVVACWESSPALPCPSAQSTTWPKPGSAAGDARRNRRPFRRHARSVHCHHHRLLRRRVPRRVPLVALSASLAPGRQRSAETGSRLIALSPAHPIRVVSRTLPISRTASHNRWCAPRERHTTSAKSSASPTRAAFRLSPADAPAAPRLNREGGCPLLKPGGIAWAASHSKDGNVRLVFTQGGDCSASSPSGRLHSAGSALSPAPGNTSTSKTGIPLPPVRRAPQA